MPGLPFAVGGPSKKINGFSTDLEVTDFSRPESKEECRIVEGVEECQDVVYYPYTISEEGVSMSNEIGLLRQAVYELRERLDEVCSKDDSYSWC